jgi:hypothetical protein
VVARQIVEVLASVLAGHAPLVPVQLSVTSQTPVDARHGAVGDANVSDGQVPPAPWHFSATSQMPLAARQVIVVPANASAGQADAVPGQVS